MTIESVLWLPLFFAFLALAFDGSVLFTNRALVLRNIQDMNRACSVGRWAPVSLTTTRANVLAFAQSVAPSASRTVDVSATGIITTTVTMPASELDTLGLFGMLSGFSVGVSADYMDEGGCNDDP